VDIFIFGQRELVDRLEQGHEPTSHLISIGNPGKGVRGTGEDSCIPPVFQNHYKSILRLGFFDVEYRRQLRNSRPKRVPMKRDVRKVIRFFRKTKSTASGYTIHCWQGISRSTAIALCLLYLIHKDESVSVEKLMEIRPEAVPHSRLVEFFDQIIGSHLLGAIAPVRERHFQDLKRWFFSEIVNGDALIEELEPIEETE
jgi:predicted protein tyrosine phosphatase